jgi:hypothetical protein
MSNLSNLQINQSFQGLLKLADSTTGITQSLQSVQDGLGNDTGLKLAQDFFTAPSLISFKPLGKATGGPGITTGAGTANPTSSQDKIFATYFLDEGINSYSGITFRVGTVTSTADEINFAFYSVAQTTQYGLAPEDLIMSGFSLNAADLAATGLITIALPSTLKFPYPGPFALLWYVSNPGNVTPTARLTGPAETASQVGLMAQMYGYIASVDGTGAQNPYYGANAESSSVYYSTTTSPFLVSYTPATIAATANSTIYSSAGFILRK